MTNLRTSLRLSFRPVVRSAPLANACRLLGASAHKLHAAYKAAPNSFATEGLKLICDLYDVERDITCDPADDRRKARKLSRL